MRVTITGEGLEYYNNRSEWVPRLCYKQLEERCDYWESEYKKRMEEIQKLEDKVAELEGRKQIITWDFKGNEFIIKIKPE